MRVRECAQASCPLHSCRLMEDGEDGSLRDCVRNFCLACAGNAEAVDECCADRPMGGQPACPAHPYRTGEAAPGSPQPVVSQQVRLLPGLGDVCARKKDSGAPEGAEAVAPLDPRPCCVHAAASTAGSTALSITHPERTPEALDI